MASGKLLASQVNIIKDVIALCDAGSAYIVLNGELGSGKTTICGALTTFYRKRASKPVLYFSGVTSSIEQIRTAIIKTFFASTEFDEKDCLTDTCQLFDIARREAVVIIDSVDCLDLCFVDELYNFFKNYSSTTNMSIILSSSRMLSNFLLREDLSGVTEKVIPHLNFSDKKNLLVYCMEKKLADDLNNRDFLADLLENCGTLPADIVKFVENNNMSGMNINEDELDKKNNSSPSSIVPNSDEAPVAPKHTIDKPSAPNKVIVISVALVLALVLIAIVAILLQKQNVSNPDEVVVAQSAIEKIDTVIESSTINGNSQFQDDDNIEQQMIDNMMSDSNEFDSDIPVDPAITEQKKENQEQQDEIPVITETNTEPQIVDSNKEKINENVKTEQQNSNVEQKGQQQTVVEETAKPDVKIDVNINQDKQDSVNNKEIKQSTVKDTVKSDANVKQNPQGKPTEPVKNAQQDLEKKKTSDSNKKDQQAKNEKKDSNAVKTDKKEVVANNKTTLKAGEVKPFSELSKTNAPTSKPVASSPVSKNFVVQVACSASKTDLQAKASKYGSNAFIYERSNNALKYVLVVGYYATQKDASEAAKKIGGGSFAKSMAAVNKERVQ